MHSAPRSAWRGSGERPFLLDNVWDLLHLLDYLEVRPDVDMARVGITGVGWGGGGEGGAASEGGVHALPAAAPHSAPSTSARAGVGLQGPHLQSHADHQQHQQQQA